MKPIHFASIQGSVNTFKALTKLGADPQSRTEDDVYKEIISYTYLLLFVTYVAWKTAYILCMCSRSCATGDYTC